MASNPSDSKPPQANGLQAMLARLRGMVQALKTTEQEGEELVPIWDAMGSPTLPSEARPTSAPAAEQAVGVAERTHTAEGTPASEPALTAEQCETAGGTSPAESNEVGEPRTPPQTEVPASSASRLCPYCQAPQSGTESYCADCGWIFPPTDATATAETSSENSRPRIRDRYELRELMAERGNVARYRGLDYGTEGGGPVAVIILRSASSEAGEAPAVAEAVPVEPRENPASDEPVPASREQTSLPQAEAVPLQPVWPSIAWERALLETLQHPVLPRLLDSFVEDGFEYVVEELPAGRPLWDAWDDPGASAEQRFAWLKQIAGALYHLSQSNALLEALRPDVVVVTPDGQPRITDLSDLLPLPLPPYAPVRATYYTAPELVLASDNVDARAGIYSFGAMLYALHVGRELTELDFELQGVPKPFLQRFPDVHPLFGRLVSKTFCRDLNGRFPTEDAAEKDPTGYCELIRALEDCRQALDSVRLEIAAWTTTGMIRSGNEDAFALLHAVEASENRLGEAALVLLADGMGGYEAGEVAAALAIQVMRNHLVQREPFAAFAGKGFFSPEHDPRGDASRGEKDSGSLPPRGQSCFPAPVETCKSLLAAALRDANQRVYEAAGTAKHCEGMGCTAEVVYVDGRHVVVGHVGDSRTYHLHEGRLVQLTRDQTWVERMMDLGVLTPQEAETHPRRSELQQAIGGRPEVEPALYDSVLKPGDWVVVCSDGFPNHLPHDTLQDMLQNAPSAEWAARRLVNYVNLAGATDNATVVVIRAM